MAIVWLARDNELQRSVALKILRPGLALEERHVDRFRREALAIARLRHPHIIQIYDVGEDEGLHYLAMEFIDGPSLATVLEALPTRDHWSADELAHVTATPTRAEYARQLRDRGGGPARTGGRGTARSARPRAGAPGREALQHPVCVATGPPS